MRTAEEGRIDMPNLTEKGSATRKTFWAVAAFYFLIGLEFLYMASPFAAYFYSVYRPTLSFLNMFPALSWLNKNFTG